MVIKLSQQKAKKHYGRWVLLGGFCDNCGGGDIELAVDT